MTSTLPPLAQRWTLPRIRELVYKKFGKRPCLWQVDVARALREKRHDVVAVAATGSGKTLSFWIALLMALEDGEDKIVVIITPLNLLGKQNAEMLCAADVSAVAVDAENATDEVFNAIEAGTYRVIVFGPELVMMEGGRCERLWQMSSFTSKILYFVFNEGHCISEWSTFRTQYKHLGSLRYILSGSSPSFYIPSATLPAAVLADVSETMHLRKGLTTSIFRSNDRPEVALAVRPIQNALNSYKDLDLLIPEDFCEGDTPPPKFLIFFDNTKEAEAAAAHLCSRLPRTLRDKVKHFHATMTSWYRKDEFEALKAGDTYGLCVTDSFGMGLDLSDIELIIQWKVPLTMNTLWQRFGRAARGDGRFAFAILFAEKEYFDEEQERKAIAAEKRKQQPSRKRKRRGNQNIPASKRPAHNPSLSDSSALQPGSNAPNTRLNPVDVPMEERRSEYDKRLAAGSVARGGGRKKKEIPLVLKDLINAQRRGFGCRRKVISLYYSNDKRGFNHKECNPDSPTGCARCSPRPLLVCCDLCEPVPFSDLFGGLSKATRKQKKSHIPPHDMTRLCVQLRQALCDWRETSTIKCFGEASLRNYNGGLLLPTQAVIRIVDCAQAGKLLALENLEREVRDLWRKDLLETHGKDVLHIIHSIFPPPPPEPEPEPEPEAQRRPQGTTISTKARRPMTCHACLQPGHTKRSRLCPKYHESYPATNPTGGASMSATSSTSSIQHHDNGTTVSTAHHRDDVH
ncbi:P-loop containing nucleoside triphosphate hydrolase protein [Earliella scabrosa]|nr:P-loop containing nucleoside triphosphate hydrolase protein [Earliella scabrosa]